MPSWEEHTWCIGTHEHTAAVNLIRVELLAHRYLVSGNYTGNCGDILLFSVLGNLSSLDVSSNMTRWNISKEAPYNVLFLLYQIVNAVPLQRRHTRFLLSLCLSQAATAWLITTYVLNGPRKVSICGLGVSLLWQSRTSIMAIVVCGPNAWPIGCVLSESAGFEPTL